MTDKAHFYDIVFDGPPGPTAGRFVEVEDHDGHSIKFGDWFRRDDGYWVLRFPAPSAMFTSTLGRGDEIEADFYRLKAQEWGLSHDEAKSRVKKALNPPKYQAVRCLCNHPTCKDWHIDPVAAVQGVSFTEEQARRVAEYLNHVG